MVRDLSRWRWSFMSPKVWGLECEPSTQSNPGIRSKFREKQKELNWITWKTILNNLTSQNLFAIFNSPCTVTIVFVFQFSIKSCPHLHSRKPALLQIWIITSTQTGKRKYLLFHIWKKNHLARKLRIKLEMSNIALIYFQSNWLRL